MPPFTAIEDLFGNLSNRQVGKLVGFASEGTTEDEENALGADFFGELGELFVFEGLGGDVEEVAFGGVALLPVEGVRGGVGKAFEFAEGFGKHGSIVSLIRPPAKVSHDRIF